LPYPVDGIDVRIIDIDIQGLFVIPLTIGASDIAVHMTEGQEARFADISRVMGDIELTAIAEGENMPVHFASWFIRLKP